MEINILIVLGILFIHFVADFIFQTDWQAQNKSKAWKPLLSHTFTYSVIWMLPICILLGIEKPNEVSNWYVCNTLLFVLITFLCHTITDYFTSRLNSRLWEKKQVHNFFVSVGADQLLHYIQLILTFYYLTK